MSDGAAGPQPEVVVVGAGPVGLLVALDLHRAGVDVAVIDARAGAARPGSRATTLNTRSMHILHTRGLLDALGEIPQILASHFAGIPVDLDEDVAFAGQWKLPQAELEAAMCAVAEQEGLDLRWNCELFGLSQDDSGVKISVRTRTGEQDWATQYLIGCDGRDSTVRSQAGIELRGDPGDRWLLRADLTGVDVTPRRFEVLDTGMATAAALPTGVVRVMAHAHSYRKPDEKSATFDDVTRVWSELTGEDIGTGTVHWVDSFTDSAQWAETFRAGRILLAGDAAHNYMPAGGMAMNLGLEDAVDLSWRLASVLHGRSSDSALDDYQRIASSNAERIARSVAAQAHLLLSEHDLGPQRKLMTDLLALDSVRSDVRATISGLGLGQRPDDRPESMVGESVPDFSVVDPAGATTSIGHHLRRGRAVLVLSGPDVRPGVADARELDRVEVLTGRITGPTGQDAPHLTRYAHLDAFLIEPSGRIGWTDAEPESLGRYFVEDVKYTMRQMVAQFGSTIPDALPRGMREVIASRSELRSGKLAGAQALVTGASRGIGRGIAMRLAADGAIVAVHCAHDTDSADEVVRQIQRAGGSAFAVTSAFDTPSHLRELTATVAGRFAEITESPTIDVLVNNAGVLGGESFEETSEAKFDDLMRVNVKAPFFLTQEVVKVMPDGGRIINISTGLTKVANPDEIAYAMTKGAIEQLTRHLAKGIAERGITVNAVAPGVTDNGSELFDNPAAVEMMSRLSPFGRVGKPDDIAAAVAFLASDDGRWITGSVIEASGGTVLG